jgi:hypothetical protein
VTSKDQDQGPLASSAGGASVGDRKPRLSDLEASRSNADHTEHRKEEGERQSGEEDFGFKKALGFGPRPRTRLFAVAAVFYRFVPCGAVSCRRVVSCPCGRVVSPLSLGPDHPQSEKLTWPEPEQRRADPGLVRVSLFW